MDYYKKRSCAYLDLENWIVDADRPQWREFIRTMLKKYGFNERFMLKLLKDSYPSLAIEEGQLVKVA